MILIKAFVAVITIGLVAVVTMLAWESVNEC